MTRLHRRRITLTIRLLAIRAGRAKEPTRVDQMPQFPIDPVAVAGYLGVFGACVAAAVRGFKKWQSGSQEATPDALTNGKRQKLVDKLTRLQTSSDDYLERIGALEADAEEGRRAHFLIREENRRIHESHDRRISKIEKRLKLRFLGDDKL